MTNNKHLSESEVSTFAQALATIESALLDAHALISAIEFVRQESSRDLVATISFSLGQQQKDIETSLGPVDLHEGMIAYASRLSTLLGRAVPLRVWADHVPNTLDGLTTRLSRALFGLDALLNDNEDAYSLELIVRVTEDGGTHVFSKASVVDVRLYQEDKGPDATVLGSGANETCSLLESFIDLCDDAEDLAEWHASIREVPKEELETAYAVLQSKLSTVARLLQWEDARGRPTRTDVESTVDFPTVDASKLADGCIALVLKDSACFKLDRESSAKPGGNVILYAREQDEITKEWSVRGRWIYDHNLGDHGKRKAKPSLHLVTS